MKTADKTTDTNSTIGDLKNTRPVFVAGLHNYSKFHRNHKMAYCNFEIKGGAVLVQLGMCVSKCHLNSNIVVLQSCPGIHHVLQT